MVVEARKASEARTLPQEYKTKPAFSLLDNIFRTAAYMSNSREHTAVAAKTGTWNSCFGHEYKGQVERACSLGKESIERIDGKRTSVKWVEWILCIGFLCVDTVMLAVGAR